MGTTDIPRNAFNALCAQAANENWCWRVNCTTCGHLLFRYGLRELARGKHPDSSSWIVSKSHGVLSRGGELVELGPAPPRWTPWAPKEQLHLAQILSQACIRDITTACSFPGWLGYLGLGLKYSEDTEKATHFISQSWAPQLLDLLPRDATSRSFLRDFMNDPGKTLCWRMLGVFETDLSQVTVHSMRS